MKYFQILLFIFFLSCNNSGNNKDKTIADFPKKSEEKENTRIFFPVTTYLKGQLFDIKNNGITPIKFTFHQNTYDSIWIKSDSLNNAFADFLMPEIDSVNLSSFFGVTNFFDESLDALTLSYDPVKPLPDTIPWQRWDIYINPVSHNVQRLYLVKRINMNTTKQLTWLQGKGCKIRTITEDLSGKPNIASDIEIKWEY